MADNPRTLREYIDFVKTHGMEYFGVYYGTYRGFIVDNKDPEKLGRVKLQVPQIAGKNTIEYWAYPFGQPAGEDFGDFMIPPKGSMVWVKFEGGNPNFPIWTGGHWAKKNASTPSEGKRSEPTNRVRKTKNLTLEMDDDNKRIKMANKGSGDNVQLDDRDFKSSVRNTSHSSSGSHSESTGGSKTVTCAASSETSSSKNITTGALGLSAASALLTIAGETMTWDSSGIKFGFNGHYIEFKSDGVYIEGRRFLDHTHNGVMAGGGSTGGVD